MDFVVYIGSKHYVDRLTYKNETSGRKHFADYSYNVQT
jgi:hypothetical protein